MDGAGSRFSHLKFDLPSSIVVFFVAVPLCLGIALASGAPLFSGIISGIVGGMVVGTLSGSALGVSGPAAGLSAVILSALTFFNNSWETFMLATIIAGLLQVMAGFFGGGVIAHYFPSSVIKGMLVGIGIIIILKQVPYALGLDGTQSEMIDEGINHIFAPFSHLSQSIQLAPTVVTVISLALLIIWDNFLAKYSKFCKLVPGPIIVVLLGIFLVWCSQQNWLPIFFQPNELVRLPASTSLSEFVKHWYFPDFSQILNPNVYKCAVLIALIASIETLLCVEATDKMDPRKRITPPDQELKAQGLGNIICGFLGGLPVTQVIVRSSANIAFGARTKLSAILHGFFILICVITIPHLLNMIPLATLATILFVVGYKLTQPNIYREMYRLGWGQFIPFVATIVGVVAEDLLLGISIGVTVAIFVILRHDYKNSHETFHYKTDKQQKIYLTLAEQVSFLNKSKIIKEFKNVPRGADIVIDFSRAKSIDHDVIEAIQDFIAKASSREIRVECIGRK